MFTVLLAPSYEFPQSQPAGDLRLIYWPALTLDEPENFQQLDEAIDNLFGYDWLLFKNEHAAEYFLHRFEVSHLADELDQVRVLAIGEATIGRLARSQIHVDVPLDRFPIPDPVASVEDYAGQLAGLNVLAPSAGVIRESFELQLIDRGARVDNVITYRTVAERNRLVELNALLAGGAIDSVVFGSPAQLDEFAQAIDSDDVQRLLSGVLVSCGDNATAAAADRFALTPTAVAVSADRDALIEALLPFR